MNLLRIRIKDRWFHRLYLVLVSCALGLALVFVGGMWFVKVRDPQEGLDLLTFLSVSALVLTPAAALWMAYRVFLFVGFGKAAFESTPSNSVVHERNRQNWSTMTSRENIFTAREAVSESVPPVIPPGG